MNNLITASKINKIKIKQKDPNGLFAEDNLLVYMDDQQLHGKKTIKIEFGPDGVGKVTIQMFALVDTEDLLVSDLNLNVTQLKEITNEN